MTSDEPDRPTSLPAHTRTRVPWLPVLAVILPASMFLLVGSTVHGPNEVPYRCPSGVHQLIAGRDVTISPIVMDGEIRLYDPRDPALINAPGVFERCREKNLQAATLAALLACLGVGWWTFRQLRPPRREVTRPAASG